MGGAAVKGRVLSLSKDEGWPQALRSLPAGSEPAAVLRDASQLQSERTHCKDEAAVADWQL
jgi:hypothetical protein